MCLGQTKTFHILSNTIPPWLSQMSNLSYSVWSSRHHHLCITHVQIISIKKKTKVLPNVNVLHKFTFYLLTYLLILIIPWKIQVVVGDSVDVTPPSQRHVDVTLPSQRRVTVAQTCRRRQPHDRRYARTVDVTMYPIVDSDATMLVNVKDSQRLWTTTRTSDRWTEPTTEDPTKELTGLNGEK